MTPHPPLARSPFSHRRRLFISSTFSRKGFVPSSLMTLQDILCIYRRFRLCITKAQSKAHTPCRAGVYSRRLNLMLRREQALALRCNPSITQIGRENNISAEICKHPYENQPNARWLLQYYLIFFLYSAGEQPYFFLKALVKPFLCS